MKKKSIRRSRIIIAAILVVILGGLFLFFLTSKDKYGDYEYDTAFTTADKAHDIVLYHSTPLLYLLNDQKYRIVCVDNSSGRETEYAEFDFEPCKGCGFSLKEDNGQKCTVVVSDCSGYRDFDIVWSEIFT